MSGARWYDPGFACPFPRNGCVPLAWTALQEPGNRTSEFARGLAIIAQRTRSSMSARHDFLLDDKFSSHATQWRIDDWARIAGLRIVATFKPEVEYREVKRTLPGHYHWDDEGNHVPVKITTVRRTGRPTVAQFLRTTGRRGRWFILTHRHAQASINGRPKGSVSKRDRVYFAVRVESL